jgi:hypothetical protein
MTPEQERTLQDLDVQIQIAEKQLRVLNIKKQIAETELEVFGLQETLRAQMREGQEEHVAY